MNFPFRSTIAQRWLLERFSTLDADCAHRNIPPSIPPKTTYIPHTKGVLTMPLTHFLSMIAFVIIAAAATVFGIQALGLPMAVMGLIALAAAVTLRASLWR